MKEMGRKSPREGASSPRVRSPSVECIVLHRVRACAYLELEEHGKDAVAQLGEERVRRRVSHAGHLLDQFAMDGQRDLRLVEDLPHGGELLRRHGVKRVSVQRR